MSGFLGGGGSGGVLPTPVTVPNGGTGLATLTDHAVMIGSGVAPVTLVGPGATGTVLKGSTGADPVFGAVDLTADVTGMLPVANGGTGANTFTDHGVLLGSGAAAFSATAVGITGTVLKGSTGADPVFGAVDLTADVTGILPVANGGTGDNTLTDHGILLGSGVGAITPMAVADNGKIIIGVSGSDPVVGSLTSSANTINVTEGPGTLNVEVSTGTLIASGFEAWSGGAPYYDDTTIGSFTVSQAGTGYVKGVPVSWAAPQTVVGLTTGNTYYIYMDSTGTIGSTATYSESLFENNVVLFEVLRDSTAPTNVQVTVKENHPYQFPWKTSVWAHDTIGPVISNQQGGANITLNGTQKIEISGADELEDHGLETTIPDSGGVAVVFEQYYTLGSGKWARNAQSDTFDGTWNNAGTPTAIGVNKYTVNRLYVSKDDLNSATPTYFSVMGDAEYNNLAQADTAIANDTIPTATGELAMLELAQLGYIVFEESSTSIVQVIIAKETARTSFSGVTATSASLVLTDTTNFDHILSTADTTVQSALETIDDFMKWTEVTGTSQSATVNNGYVANNAGLVTVTLPDTAALGSVIKVLGKGAGKFKIGQNAGETIRIGSLSTTTGVGGSITADIQYGAVTLTCITANTEWLAIPEMGNFTVV